MLYASIRDKLSLKIAYIVLQRIFRVGLRFFSTPQVKISLLKFLKQQFKEIILQVTKTWCLSTNFHISRLFIHYVK